VGTKQAIIANANVNAKVLTPLFVFIIFLPLSENKNSPRELL